MGNTKILLENLERRGIKAEATIIAEGLLKLVRFVDLVAVSRFDVAENFKEGNIVGGRKIGWVGPVFIDKYYGLVEEEVPARTIPIWELVNSSLDPPVMHILGGVDDQKTQTHLAHTFQLMELGERGFGRLDGYANFSYKRSRGGELWVPGWGVDGDELHVEAYSSSRRREWAGGRRVSGG